MTGTKTLVEPVALDHLEDLASRVPTGRCVVELGVHRGDSLLRLARGSRRGSRVSVFGIDPYGLDGAYPGRPHMARTYGPSNQRAALRQLGQNGFTDVSTPAVHIIREFSVSVGRVWSGAPVGLLFVDAVHREAEVLADHAAWAPHLAAGAVVAFDDYCPRFPGVMKAVDRLYGDRFQLVGSRLAVIRFDNQTPGEVDPVH